LHFSGPTFAWAAGTAVGGAAAGGADGAGAGGVAAGGAAVVGAGRSGGFAGGLEGGVAVAGGLGALRSADVEGCGAADGAGTVSGGGAAGAAGAEAGGAGTAGAGCGASLFSPHPAASRTAARKADFRAMAIMGPLRGASPYQTPRRAGAFSARGAVGRRC
jgi:hypothetical protein